MGDNGVAHEDLRMLYVKERDSFMKKTHELKIASLTLNELSALPQYTKVYRSIGKSYIIGDLSSVKDRLQGIIQSASVEQEKIKERLQIVEEKMKSTQL